MKYLILIIIFILLGSCNIFDWTDNEPKASDKAEQAYLNKDYIEALRILNEALLNDPYNSELLYLRVKANLQSFYIDGDKIAALDAISLLDQINALDNPNNKSIPFYKTLVDPFTGRLLSEDPSTANDFDRKIKNIELSKLGVLIDDLAKIYNSETHGPIHKDYIQTEYALLLTIKGLVKIRDTSRDSILDDADFYFDFTGKKQGAGTDYIASLNLIPDSLLKSTGNILNLNDLTTMKTYMRDNNIRYDINNFRPDSIMSHKVFFDLFILNRVSPKVIKLFNDLISIKIQFKSVIHNGDIITDPDLRDHISGKKGELFLGLDILKQALNNDEGFERLENFLSSASKEMDNFSKAKLEKEMWIKYIRVELKIYLDLIP